MQAVKRISALVVFVLSMVFSINRAFADAPFDSQLELQVPVTGDIPIDNQYREPMPSEEQREFLVYTTKDVIRLRSQTGLSTREVLHAIGIASKNFLQPETVLIMRQLGKDWDEIEEVANFLRDGLYMLSAPPAALARHMPQIPQNASDAPYSKQIQEFARAHVEIDVNAQAWEAVGVSETELLYLVFASLVLDFSLDNALRDARLMSAEEVRGVIKTLAQELHLPDPQVLQERGLAALPMAKPAEQSSLFIALPAYYFNFYRGFECGHAVGGRAR